jgi:CHAT domain-containing protein
MFARPYDPDSLIKAKNREANELFKHGYYFDSEEVLREVLELKKKHFPNKLKNIGGSYSNLGILNKRTYRYEKAMEYYNKAEYIFKNMEDASPRLAAVYQNKSSLYHSMSNNYMFERYLNEAKAILDTIEIPYYIDMSDIYNSFAFLAMQKGNNEEGLSYFKMAEETEGPNNKLRLYLSIVRTFLFKENLSEDYKSLILHYFEKFESAVVNTNDVEREIYYYLYRGVYQYKYEKNKELALDYYNKALDLMEIVFTPDHPVYPLAYFHLMYYFYKEKNYLLALDYIQKAFSSLSKDFKAIGNYNNPEVGSFNNYSLVLHFLQYKILSFLHLYTRDSNVNYLHQARINSDYTLTLMEDLKWKYDHEKHRYYISETETESFKIAEKINHELYKLTGEHKYIEKAFQLTERAKAFSLLINLREEQAMQFGGIPEDLINKEADIIQRISAHTEFILEEENTKSPSEEKIRNWENMLFNLNQEHEQLIEFFESNYPDYYRLKYDTRVMNSSQIEDKLRKDEVLLEYSLMDSILYTYVISSEKTMVRETKIDSSFRDKCLDFYNVITEQSFSYGVRETFREYVESGYELYEVLIKPIQNEIKGKNIILIPDGEISYISFEALLTEYVDPEDVSYYGLPYLVYDHGFSNSFSATVHFTEPSKQVKTKSGILAFAPSYSNISAQNTGFQLLRQDDMQKLIRIPGVKEEVRKISDFMNADVYMDISATESNFKNNAPDYKVLHLAMHAILDDNNPLYSKLAFTQLVDTTEDGFLHTFEIYNMQLNADLAVLSSCNSGFGELQEGEGMQSLARGFAYAGCPSILMTLWEVADHSTVELMERFYFYLDKGYSKNEALQRSKVDFLSNADQLKSNPFFWSSFVLLGDTEPIYTDKTYVHMMNLGILFIPLPILWLMFIRYRKNEKEEMLNRDQTQDLL